MSLKISQLPYCTLLGNSDLIEISQYMGNNSYTSSKATLEEISEFVNAYTGTQYGEISGSLFSGTPLIYQVTLSFPYQNLTYIITITGEDLRIWSIANKTTSSFVVSSNSNIPFTGYVYWRTDKL